MPSLAVARPPTGRLVAWGLRHPTRAALDLPQGRFLSPSDRFALPSLAVARPPKGRLVARSISAALQCGRSGHPCRVQGLGFNLLLEEKLGDLLGPFKVNPLLLREARGGRQTSRHH